MGGNLCIRNDAICKTEDRQITVLDISETHNIGYGVNWPHKQKANLLKKTTLVKKLYII